MVITITINQTTFRKWLGRWWYKYCPECGEDKSTRGYFDVSCCRSCGWGFSKQAWSRWEAFKRENEEISGQGQTKTG